MDSELREYLKDMRATMQESVQDLRSTMASGHSKLEGNLHAMTNAFQAHTLESGVRWTELDARARSAHKRLDEHSLDHQKSDERRFQSKIQGKGMLIATWVAIGTTLATLIVTIVLALHSKI